MTGQGIVAFVILPGSAVDTADVSALQDTTVMTLISSGLSGATSDG